ncbi:hypothetical protein HO133_009575 [Letharia lupina]|uniref:Uncharacterized protein n=1 Tax=Letharia lupina TaxID=560253 RepID=A0A8H6FEM9_9LECA|nr:uncharacterized protein HO133_009575 [Letharia lupina]KAF6225575.1 hypothetical protein HO133_009575 [Letharia lupina]
MAFNSPIPGFSAEQVRSITKLIEDVLDKALDKHFGPLPPHQKQSVIMPKPAQPPKQEQEHRPLQQANVEKMRRKLWRRIRARTAAVLFKRAHSPQFHTRPLCRIAEILPLASAVLHFLPRFSPLFSPLNSPLFLLSPLRSATFDSRRIWRL